MPAEIPVPVAASEDLHAWEAGGAASAPALSAWVGARLAAHEAALAAVVAVDGPRTPENSLRLYDEAIEQLSLAGAQAGVLNSVAADKTVRDQAQAEAQRHQLEATYLTLTSNVVAAAVQEASLRGQISATREIVDIESQLLELLRRQNALGQIAEADVLAQEAALLAERSDISEELVRLKTHADQVDALLSAEGETGKKLDFLLQEMNRETNTILSKTGGLGETGLTLTDLGLAAKAEIDRIREQSLNIE